MSPNPVAIALKAKMPGLAWTDNHEASVWLRNEINAVLQRVRGLQMELCPHLSPGWPAAVALWAAERMVCAACLSTIRPDGLEDHRCDRCGDIADTLHPCLNVVETDHGDVNTPGPLVIFYGLCLSCRDREVR
jgi:hypothetical protein